MQFYVRYHELLTCSQLICVTWAWAASHPPTHTSFLIASCSKISCHQASLLLEDILDSETLCSLWKKKNNLFYFWHYNTNITYNTSSLWVFKLYLCKAQYLLFWDLNCKRDVVHVKLSPILLTVLIFIKIFLFKSIFVSS